MHTIPCNAVQENKYSVYRNAVQRSNLSFECIDCGMTLLPKEYESHCKVQHDINPKIICVWCRNVTWKSGQKSKYTLHLKECLDTFLLNPLLFVPNTKQLKLLDSQPIYHEHYLYDGFPSLPAEDDEFPPPYALVPDPFPIDFRNENQNLAMGLVAHFMKCQNTHEWYHVMIKAITHSCFSSHVSLAKGHVQVAPFSCWCNGGDPTEEIKYRQHRHMIIACSPIGYFKKSFWPNIKLLTEYRRKSNFPSKRIKKIETPLHLINTIGYLSQRPSRCTSHFNGKTNYQNNHFYLYKTLPERYHLPLVLLFEGGLEKLLYQQKFQNVSLSDVMKFPIEKSSNGQFCQQIKHFYKHEQGWVLPVSKTWMATHQKTDHFFYLMNGKKLYFKQNDENALLDDAIWLKTQAQGGNMFYDNVEEAFWVPRPQDQKMLRNLIPKMEKNKTDHDEIIECTETILRLQTDMDDLQRKLDDSLQKNETLQTHNHELLQKNERLQTHNHELLQKNETLQTHNHELLLKNEILQNDVHKSHEKIVTLHDTLIKDLRKEIERLNHELKRKDDIILSYQSLHSSPNSPKRPKKI